MLNTFNFNNYAENPKSGTVIPTNKFILPETKILINVSV